MKQLIVTSYLQSDKAHSYGEDGESHLQRLMRFHRGQDDLDERPATTLDDVAHEDELPVDDVEVDVSGEDETPGLTSHPLMLYEKTKIARLDPGL